MTAKLKSWVCLFGGANRSQIVNAMFTNNISVEAIVIPKSYTARLYLDILEFKKLGISILYCDTYDLSAVLLDFTLHPIISIGFPYILPDEILTRHPISINVHPTLLPRYRGPTTGAYIIKNGESLAGSTVHFITPDVDKGDIILQKSLKLTPFDTVKSMQRKVYALEPHMVLQAIDILHSSYVGEKQDELFASTFLKRRRPSDSKIDIEKSVRDLFDDIRACDPVEYPAYFFWHGEKVCITLWRPNKDKSQEDEI